MSTGVSKPPFSENALNRFRLSHADQTRGLSRRLNRLPLLSSVSAENEANAEEAAADAAADAAAEAEIARLEIQRWRFGVERNLASVRALDRQRDEYVRKRQDTIARTESLRATLAEEKEQLAAGLVEREHRMRCDEVAKKIVARGKTRKELDEQITQLQASIVEHRARYAEMLSVAQTRADSFARITALVDECRALKMPVYESEPDELPAPSAALSPPPAAPAARLNATSLPFQPTTSRTSGGGGGGGAATSASAPASRGGTPGPSHGLPARPASRSSNRYPSSSASRANLPQRPSALRNVTGGAGMPGSLEDGEVGEEDGEVRESAKRKAADDGGAARSTRAKR